jgi:hypothetical protein
MWASKRRFAQHAERNYTPTYVGLFEQARLRVPETPEFARLRLWLASMSEMFPNAQYKGECPLTACLSHRMMHKQSSNVIHDLIQKLLREKQL